MFSLPSPSRCWLPNNSVIKAKQLSTATIPLFFWVLSVSCSCLAKLIFTKYELQISMCLLGIFLLIRSSLRHNRLQSSQNFSLRLQSYRISKSPILFSTLVGITPLNGGEGEESLGCCCCFCFVLFCFVFLPRYFERTNFYKFNL